MIFHTIGVYNSSEEEFFNKISENYIDVFIDIRQRRGVRGSKYKFVNSIRLQEKLKHMDVRYIHVKDLAPTQEIRDVQKKVDENLSEKKRTREVLGEAFVKQYKQEIIQKYDFPSFVDSLETIHAANVALFCVEERSEACHRSIVSNKLSKLGYKIRDL